MGHYFCFSDISDKKYPGKERERERGAEDIFKEMIAENFPNLGKKLCIQAHEANRTPNHLNEKDIFPGHTQGKLSKFNVKEEF